MFRYFNHKIASIIILVSIPLVTSFYIRVLGDDDVFSISTMQFPSQVFTTISRFTEEVKEFEELIPFNTNYVDDSEKEYGTETILEDGKEGKKKLIVTVTYYDEKEYERIVKEEIIEEPIHKFIAKGTKVVPKTLDTEYGGLTYIRKFSDVWATSYDSTCPGCSGTTATGMQQGYGVVAVDPKLIPLRSKLYIPGYGMAVAGDVGGSIKGKRIDLGFDSLNGQWKAHYVDVYLLTD